MTFSKHMRRMFRSRFSPPPPPDVVEGDFITDLRIESVTATQQTNIPVTFGQVFAVGDVPSTATLTGKINTIPITLQVNKKATYSDGSLKHAIISTVLPSLSASTTVALNLYNTTASAASASVGPASLLAAGFDTTVRVTIGGNLYTASANALLSAGTYTTWLSGSLINEWHCNMPLKNAGSAHPHLMARFAIRGMAGTARARVDVAVEQGWAYQTGPANITCDVAVVVGATTAYTKLGMVHYHHARWRKLFWFGTAPATHEAHNAPYMISTKAVPYYDPSTSIAESLIVSFDAKWNNGTNAEPMNPGVAEPYMPSTGGRPDVGLLPGWTVTYLLSMDKRAKRFAIGTADLAGSWSAHYRDQNTDRPVSLFQYPYIALAGRPPGDSKNPATGLQEIFPTETGANPNDRDNSHHPSLSYLPYIVTGDFYHLEELQFWAHAGSWSSNPAYRGHGRGLFRSDQVRGQAWLLRTMVQAAYITPDNDTFKTQFEYYIEQNRLWYTGCYVDSSVESVSAGYSNSLGILTNGYAVVYDNGVGIAPWQDDFFTAACGHAVELGYTGYADLLEWKSKFSVQRMIGPGFCWVHGAAYNLTVRDTASASFYDTIAQVSDASHDAQYEALTCGSQAMATYFGESLSSMTGYPSIATGYPSCMQPALAYATYAGANTAWTVFMNRSVKPNYGTGPQFGIVPRP